MLGADLLIIGDGGAQTVGEGRVEQAVLRLYGGQVYRARNTAHYGLHRLLEISLEPFLQMTEISFYIGLFLNNRKYLILITWGCLEI